MLQVDIYGHLYVGEMATHFGNKTFKRPGGLAFPQYGNMADVSRLLLLGACSYLGQPQELIFLINPNNKLNIEQSK